MIWLKGEERRGEERREEKRRHRDRTRYFYHHKLSVGAMYAGGGYDTNYKLQNTKYKITDSRYETPGTKDKIATRRNY